MTPNVGNQLKADWTIQKQPSKTYKLNRDTQTIVDIAMAGKHGTSHLFDFKYNDCFEWIIY